MQIPKYAQPGQPSQELWVNLELKVIADVGLVGFPNVGKSTLLSRVTNADPKIANYHFTTLNPNLGVVDLPDGRGFVMADIPGLIEGASEGVGLGHEFLRHIEPKGIRVFPISGVTGAGIKELLYYVSDRLSELDQAPVIFEPEYFPEEELIHENLPYTVEKEDDIYVVEGPKIEKMLGYTNLDSEKGFAFFQKFLKDTGILDELEDAGIQEGDTVRMYGLQFDYYK